VHFTLSGGLRVVVEPMPHVRTVAIGVFVRAGARDELDVPLGTAHLLEHMLFKGSTGRDAALLARAMDDLGGQFNAYTTQEFTCFHARTLSEHAVAALELLAELVTRPALRVSDLERERSIVLDELRWVADDPEELLEEDFARALWEDHPLAHPEAGTPEEVSGCTVEDLVRFYRAHYVAARTVIVAAGAVQPEAFLDGVQRTFSLPAGVPVGHSQPPTAAGLALQRIWPGEQARLVIGQIGPSLADDRRWPAALLVSILGGSQSSRLFQLLREERGLCYDVAAFDATFSDAGYIAMTLATSPAHAEEAVALALGVVEDVARQGVLPEEVERHRRLAIQQLWMAWEGPETRMTALGRAAVLDRPLEVAGDAVRRLEAVSPEEIVAVLRSLGEPAGWAAAAVVPAPRRLGPWAWRVHRAERGTGDAPL